MDSNGKDLVSWVDNNPVLFGDNGLNLDYYRTTPNCAISWISVLTSSTSSNRTVSIYNKDSSLTKDRLLSIIAPANSKTKYIYINPPILLKEGFRMITSANVTNIILGLELNSDIFSEYYQSNSAANFTISNVNNSDVVVNWFFQRTSSSLSGGPLFLIYQGINDTKISNLVCALDTPNNVAGEIFLFNSGEGSGLLCKGGATFLTATSYVSANVTVNYNFI